MTSSTKKQPRETQLASLRDDLTLATLTKKSGFSLVTIPPVFAKGTVVALFDLYHMEGVRVWTADDAPPGLSLEANEWCVAFPLSSVARWQQRIGSFLLLPLAQQQRSFVFDGALWVGLVYEKYKLQMQPRRAHHALEALDLAKMEAVPEGELPAPWVQPSVPTDALFQRGAEGEHSVEVSSLSALPVLPPYDENPLPSVVTDEEIERAFADIRAHLELPVFPLVLRRGKVNKRGFVTGQICFDATLTPLRMAITTCPNADLAEVIATLVHEFTHLLVPRDAHGQAFKRALVALAGALYGPVYMAEASARIDASYRVVDLWVAVGIRAALQHQAPPVAKAPEERVITRVVGQIQMLRALAADQVGRPEGINATAIANTKIATHGLEAYQVKLDLSVDDQMVDLWIDVGKRVAWRRNLMFAVAEYCHVFALSMNARGWMHLFGKHQHVVTAEYLFDICKEQIERSWEAHKVQWKEEQRAQGIRVTGGASRSERTSFCQAAVRGLKAQMSAYQESDEAGAFSQRHAQEELAQAERFTAGEYQRRGLKWVGGAGSTVRHNPSGYEAGRSIQFNVGIEGVRAGRKQLSARKSKP